MQRFLIVGMGLLMTTTNLPAQTVSLRNGAETATAGNPLQSVSGATIYEVNLRQYTPEGTFEAFRREIPRLKSLGVGILWLMPIHPIGNESRKGTLGSYYAASDYKAVNPEFGTDQDFRNLMHDAQIG
ncbi:MAG: alpha-amylase family glycosyl hydrolase, partial [Phycisphaerae bacterium]